MARDDIPSDFFNDDINEGLPPPLTGSQNPLVRRLINLLKDLFPETANHPGNYTFDFCKRPRIETIIPLLHTIPYRALKFTVGDTATTAMLIVDRGQTQPDCWGRTAMERHSIERDVLANDCWDAFIGWTSNIKDSYEKGWKP